MASTLSGITAVTFDGYGTLIDWRAGVTAYVEPILAALRRPDVTPTVWADEWRRTLRQDSPFCPYKQLVTRSYEATMRHFELAAFADGGPGLAQSVSRWPPTTNARTLLRRLARRFRLGIVANVDKETLADSVAVLGAPFSSLVTSEEVRSYKPGPEPFIAARERLGVHSEQLLHVAVEVAEDLEPARALGFRTALIHSSEEWELALPSLEALAELLLSLPR